MNIDPGIGRKVLELLCDRHDSHYTEAACILTTRHRRGVFGLRCAIVCVTLFR